MIHLSIKKMEVHNKTIAIARYTKMPFIDSMISHKTAIKQRMKSHGYSPSYKLEQSLILLFLSSKK